MLKAPPNGRGPIAGSKRVSSSLSSVRRRATSVVGSAYAATPTSTTTPGTEDVRGDLGTLTKASPVSPPEKTGSLETSNHSSPATLTRTFDGDAIPITTNDLGRLPLHHGVKFPINFDFEAIANGWNPPGPSQTSAILSGGRQGPGLSQGDAVDSRGTQAGVTPGLYPPQEQHPEDFFPWMSYSTTIEAEGTPTDSAPTLATAATTARPNAASVVPNQTKPTADRLDSTIPTFFEDVPPPSTTFGPTTDPVYAAEGHTNLFNTLFPSSHPPAETHAAPMVQPHGGHEEQEQGYRSLPTDAQAYLHGWSNAPRAFEYVEPSSSFSRNAGI